MSLTYKKGEIVWAKIQGYSWWPGRITQIKLKLNIKKNNSGKMQDYIEIKKLINYFKGAWVNISNNN